jgi:DNA polymerase III delta prime subunit
LRGALSEVLAVVKGYKAKDSLVELRRPIICICNDKHAPVLRELRPHCLELDLAAPKLARLVRRMTTVADAEHVPLDETALAMLCEAAHNDIRASLTALQWAARSSDRRAADGAPLAQRDVTTGLFDVWRRVLTKRAPQADVCCCVDVCRVLL